MTELLVSGLVTLLIFVFGAAIGSFLNVVVYRVPTGRSLLHPPSQCPHCTHRLQPYDNVPVLGWLWLRGRCRYCRTLISMRYPLVEAATGCLFLLTFWAATQNSADFLLPTIGKWIFFSWLLALALIDWDTMTLPNSLTQSGLVAGVVFQMIVGWSAAGWSGVASHFLGSVVGAVVGLGVFDLITIF